MNMKKPVEHLLDNVEWKPMPPLAGGGGPFPYATHEGVLQIGELNLRVYQLNTGQRVIREEDLEKFLAGG